MFRLLVEHFQFKVKMLSLFHSAAMRPSNVAFSVWKLLQLTRVEPIACILGLKNPRFRLEKSCHLQQQSFARGRYINKF